MHLFAFTKATEGLDYTDRLYHQNAKGTFHAKLINGPYHFARPQPGRSAKDEAHHHLQVVHAAGGIYKGALPPTLDLEWVSGLGTSELQSWTKTWLQTVEKEVGVRPFIYTGQWFWGPRLGDPRSFFGRYPLWLAAYVNNPAPFVPSAWKTWTFWQFTDKGSVPGISMPCDVSRFNGSLAQLQKLTIP